MRDLFEVAGNLKFLSSLLGALFAAFTGYFLTYFFEVKTKQQRHSCKSDILQGIENEMLQWDDLEVLAQRWNQSRTDIHWILSDLLHDSLSSKNTKATDIYHKVKDLLKTEHNTEPFAELPESIRIHIEGVATRFRESGSDVLRPLAASICDIIVESDKKAETQRKLTMWSFFVGIISLFVGIVSLAFAISVVTPSISEKVQQEQNNKPTVTGDTLSDTITPNPNIGKGSPVI